MNRFRGKTGNHHRELTGALAPLLTRTKDTRRRAARAAVAKAVTPETEDSVRANLPSGWTVLNSAKDALLPHPVYLKSLDVDMFLTTPRVKAAVPFFQDENGVHAFGPWYDGEDPENQEHAMDQRFVTFPATDPEAVDAWEMLGKNWSSVSGFFARAISTVMGGGSIDHVEQLTLNLCFNTRLGTGASQYADMAPGIGGYIGTETFLYEGIEDAQPLYLGQARSGNKPEGVDGIQFDGFWMDEPTTEFEERGTFGIAVLYDGTPPDAAYRAAEDLESSYSDSMIDEFEAYGRVMEAYWSTLYRPGMAVITPTSLSSAHAPRLRDAIPSPLVDVQSTNIRDGRRYVVATDSDGRNRLIPADASDPVAYSARVRPFDPHGALDIYGQMDTWAAETHRAPPSNNWQFPLLAVIVVSLVLAVALTSKVSGPMQPHQYFTLVSAACILSAVIGLRQ